MATPLSSIKSFEEYLYRCLKCGTCRGDTVIDDKNVYYAICPMYLATAGFEPYTPRGKMLLLQAYLEGKVEPGGLREYIFTCTNCNACTELCPLLTVPRVDYKTKQVTNEKLFNPCDIIEIAKKELASKGIVVPRHAQFAEWTKKEHNPYLEPHDKRFAWFPKDVRDSLPKTAEYVYFVGCTSSYRTIEIALNTIELLRKIGIDFTIIDEWCCGSPLWRTGRPEIAQELAQHNIKEIERVGARYVLTSCAGCYRSLKLDYPKIIPGKMSIEVIHVVELIHKLAKSGALKFRKVPFLVNTKVTYHDPCHLGRHCGVYEVPREVICMLPGVNFIEMPRNRKGSLCCGSGGGVKSGFPDIAIKLASLRIQEAISVEANCLISTCPFCKRNFDDANKNLGNVIQVYDLVELVNKALG